MGSLRTSAGLPAAITEPGKPTLYDHPDHVQYREHRERAAGDAGDGDGDAEGYTLDTFLGALDDEDKEEGEAFGAWYRKEGLSERLALRQWVRLFNAFTGRFRPNVEPAPRASLAPAAPAAPAEKPAPKAPKAPQAKPSPATMSTAELVRKLQAPGVLTDDLRKKAYQGNPCAVAGHCYVASEALYHLKGGPKSGLHPMNVQHEGTQHWFLKSDAGEIVDPTAAQFKTPVPYDKARGRGFLTKKPSARAAEVIRRVKGGSSTSNGIAFATARVSKKELDLAATLLRERGFAYLDKDGTSRDGSRLVTDLGPAIIQLAKNGVVFAIDQGGGWTRYTMV